VLVVCAAAQSTLAHPFHVSIADAEYNRNADAIEVSLRVDPTDLEQALRTRTGEHIVLETAPDIDENIAAYLRDVFIVRRADGTNAPLQWVGKELSLKAVWLHFQLDEPGKLDGAVMVNRVLFDVLPSQTNTVNLTVDRRLHTLTFTPQRAEIPLSILKEDRPPNQSEEEQQIDALYVQVFDDIQHSESTSTEEKTALEIVARSLRAMLELVHDGKISEAQRDAPLNELLPQLNSHVAANSLNPNSLTVMAIESARRGEVKMTFHLAQQVVLRVTHARKGEDLSAVSAAVLSAAALAKLEANHERAEHLAEAADGPRDAAVNLFADIRHELDHFEHAEHEHAHEKK